MFTSHRSPARMRLPDPLQVGSSVVTHFSSNDLCRENFQLYLQDDSGRNVVLLLQYMFRNKLWLLNHKDDGQWGAHTVMNVFQLSPSQTYTIDISLKPGIFLVVINESRITEVPVMVRLRLATKVLVRGPITLHFVTFTLANGTKHLLFDSPLEMQPTQRPEKSKDKPPQGHSSLDMETKADPAAPPAEGNVRPSTSSSISPPDSPPRADDASPDRRFSASELSRLKDKAALAFQEMKMKSLMRTEKWKQQFWPQNQLASRPSLNHSVKTLTLSQAFTIEPEDGEPSQVTRSVTFLDTMEPQHDASTARVSSASIQPRSLSDDPEPVSTGFLRMLEAGSDSLTQRRLSDETPYRERQAALTDKPFSVSLVSLLAKNRRVSKPNAQGKHTSAARSDSNTRNAESVHQQDAVASALVINETAPTSDSPATSESTTTEAETSDKRDSLRSKSK